MPDYSVTITVAVSAHDADAALNYVREEVERIPVDYSGTTVYHVTDSRVVAL